MEELLGRERDEGDRQSEAELEVGSALVEKPEPGHAWELKRQWEPVAGAAAWRAVTSEDGVGVVVGSRRQI